MPCVWHAKLINSLLQKLTSHPAAELSGTSAVLTMEHEVDVALFLLITNEKPQTSHQRTWKESEASPCSPATLAAPERPRAGTSWHGCVIVAEEEVGVRQVYRASSIKLRPKTASWAGRVENKPTPCLGVPLNISLFSVYILCLYEYVQVCIQNSNKWINCWKTKGQCAFP